jgi:outer membrane protein assembly factor BamB
VWTSDSPKLPLAEMAREELLGLVANQQWPEIQQTTNILTTYGYLGNPQQNAQLAATSHWANASAAEYGGEEPIDEESSVLDVRWRHPLSIELSKEGFNVLAELEVALANRAYKDACQIVTSTRGAGAFGLLPSGKDSRLWSSFPLAVSDTMRRFPKMQETMREQYGAVGLLRVKRSMGEADDRSLEMATVQFYGTPAAALAHFWLGDRSLAAGDFVRAIRHYMQAEADAEVALRSQITAHRRLASALAGEDWGTTVTNPVRMGENQMPAERFEALVTELLQREKSASGGAELPSDASALSAKRVRTPLELMPAPVPTAFLTTARGKLERLAGAPPGAAQQSAQAANVDWVAGNFAGVVEKDLLYYTDGAQATAWNLPSGTQVWRTAIAGPGGSAQQLGLFPLRPLLVEGLLVVRRRIQQGYGIVALRAENGELAWQAEGQLNEAYKYTGISDPVAWSDEILSLAAEPLGKQSLVSLLAHDANSGRLRRKLPVGLFSQAWLQYQACSLVVHGDSVIAVLGGSALCFDPEGELRWVRRLGWISPDIALDFGTREVLPPAIHGERMYVAAPGTQGLECLDVSTGKLLWKRPLCAAQRTLGVQQGVAVVETAAGLVGFDTASGEMRWQVDDSQRLNGACSMGPGGMVYTRKVAAPEPNQFHPQLVWIDPVTGQEKARSTLWQLQASHPGFGPIFSTKSQTFALFGDNATQLSREVFELTPDSVGEPLEIEPEVAALPLQNWTSEVSPRMVEAVQSVLPEWTVLNADSGPLAGLVPEHLGRKNVLALKTANNRPTRLARFVKVSERGQTTLELDFASQPSGTTILLARVGDMTLWRKKIVGAETAGAWQQVQIDLTPFAGLAVWVQIQQIPTGQANEEAFLSQAEVKHSP